MPHNLLAQSFYNRSTSPAWHALGINDPADHTAEQALRRFQPDGQEPFGVQKVPLTLGAGYDDVQVGSRYFALVRDAIPTDPNRRVLGSPVGEDYEVIDPLAAARLWDGNVKRADGSTAPIETLGILGMGERVFITTQLPTYSVKGDEVASYLLGDFPLENGSSIGMYTTGVRVVCQNTLRSGIASASERMNMTTHTKGVSLIVARHLSTVYERALRNAQLLEQGFTQLASTKIKLPAVKWIAENVYPLPPRPIEDSPNARRPWEDRLKIFERDTDNVLRVREEIVRLYEGKGVGMDTPAVKGTAFGAYNAFAEFETYRRGSYAASVSSLISGSRGARIENAFKLAMVADRYKTISVAELELVQA